MWLAAQCGVYPLLLQPVGASRFVTAASSTAAPACPCPPLMTPAWHRSAHCCLMRTALAYNVLVCVRRTAAVRALVCRHTEGCYHVLEALLHRLDGSRQSVCELRGDQLCHQLHACVCETQMLDGNWLAVACAQSVTPVRTRTSVGNWPAFAVNSFSKCFACATFSWWDPTSVSTRGRVRENRHMHVHGLLVCRSGGVGVAYGEMAFALCRWLHQMIESHWRLCGERANIQRQLQPGMRSSLLYQEGNPYIRC